MRKVLWVAGLLAIAIAASFLYKVRETARQDRQQAAQTRFNKVGDPLWEAPDFSLVGSNGQPVGRKDLENKIWIAAFIFTRCPGPCPLITQRMAEVHRQLEGAEDFRLASFTVDPSYDRPEVLKKYAEQWNADSEKWLFMTSPEPDDEIMLTLAGNFKVAASRALAVDDSGLPDIAHGTNILLVDQRGWVRAIYDSADPDSPSQIVEGYQRLHRED